MSTIKGYIRLYRDIREHWVWSDAETLRAWIDLIMMVNHEDRQVFFNGKLITVKRGSCITSIRKLAIRWGWGKNRVTRFLETLERDGMLDTKRDSKKTLLTIENYGKYQPQPSKSGTATRTLTRTQTETQTRTQTDHKQYIKNTLENIKKENPPSGVDDEPGEPWPDDFFD